MGILQGIKFGINVPQAIDVGNWGWVVDLLKHKNGGKLTAKMYCIKIITTINHWKIGQIRAFVSREEENSKHSQPVYRIAMMSKRELIKMTIITSVVSTPNL